MSLFYLFWGFACVFFSFEYDVFFLNKGLLVLKLLRIVITIIILGPSIGPFRDYLSYIFSRLLLSKSIHFFPTAFGKDHPKATRPSSVELEAPWVVP